MTKPASMPIMLTLLILAVALIHTIQPTRAATTIYVDDDNTIGPWNGTQAFPYRNITHALTAAQTGDTIFIKNGTYHEHIAVNETLTIKGESTEGTIIDGDYQEFLPIVRIDKPNVLVANLTVKKTSPSEETYGILIFRTQNVTLLNLEVRENYRAIMITHSHYCKVINSSIVSNYASGISSLENCSYSLFTGNLIMQNPIGILLQSDTCRNNTIYHNTFLLNIQQASSQGTGIMWDNGYPPIGFTWFPMYGGNYWSDHATTDAYRGPNQDIPGSDGIVDSTYVASDGVRDNYPLRNPWGKVPPIADFTFTPASPTKDEETTFNATGSFDADGNITSYNWNFGDGNTTTVATPVIVHSYADFADYIVTLTVTDNSGLENAVTKTIHVQKKTATLTITAVPNTIAVTESTTINGTLTIRGERAPGETVVLRFRTQGEQNWQNLTNVITSSSGVYQYLWSLDSLGIYEVNALFQGDETTEPANKATLLTITKKSATLTIGVSPTTLIIGQNVTITGSIVPASQENITLSYQLLNDSWSTIATVMTNANGEYSLTYTTTRAGILIFSATWQGNDQTYPATDSSGMITVSRMASNLTVTTNTPDATRGNSLQISGKLTPTSTNASIALQIWNATQTMVANVTLELDNEGTYNFMWTPQNAGTHRMKASWLGDAYTNPSQAQLTIEVAEKAEYPLWQYATIGAIIVFVILAVFILRRRR